jgi:hypothetical protein
VNPKTLLTASGISPDHVAFALPGIDFGQIVIRSAPSWLTRLWGKAVSAMTLRTTIYIRSDVLEAAPSVLGPLIVHELVHVQQWKQFGVVRFLWKYVAGYFGGRLTGLPHRDAYRVIPIEVEAREIANQLQGSIGPF